MSYNTIFYNRFRGNNFTFQNRPPLFPPNVPPPPIHPPYFIPPIPQRPADSDEEFVKRFESAIPVEQNEIKPKTVTISEVKENLCNLVLKLNKLKERERILSSNSNTLPDEEWSTRVAESKDLRAEINDILTEINNLNLDVLRKLVAKRSAKRARLKRLRLERKQEKEVRMKKLEDRSRKIDENLQKIKDEIRKVEQEKEAKAKADIVLREVIRKKTDAKKFIAKLDALINLRKARVNTARGRGENVSENETVKFNINLEKVKCLWAQKLATYEKEESDLRAQLEVQPDSASGGLWAQKLTTYEKEESDLRAQLEVQPDSASGDMDKHIVANLDKWREFLFGGGNPQLDFGGNIGQFVEIRSQWDKFVSDEGTSIPVGWVVPDLK